MIEAILQDFVLEVILERDLKTQIDLKIDPGIIPRNHIINPEIIPKSLIINQENNLKNIINSGMCHHDPRTLITIHLEISFPEFIEIHLINPEVQVLIPDQGGTVVIFSVSIVWNMDT
ncbi:MAG: hypothetical protein GY861_05215 [bacterium]|nr:hypothetical protein [bacterium]